MISLYQACLRRLGLSIEAAGTVHARYGKAVRPDTIKSWSSGRVLPQPGVFDELRAFARDQERAVADELDAEQALALAGQVDAAAAAERGLPGPNALMAAIAGRLLAS